RALPVSHPESLAVLNWRSIEPRGVRPNHVMHGSDGSTWTEKNVVSGGVFPYGAFRLPPPNTSPFSKPFASYPTQKRCLTIKGQSELATGEYVSGYYFSGLEVRPAAGRTIVPDDDRVGAPVVAVISLRLSERRFSNAADALGQTVLIDNLPATVVGV